MWYILEWNFFNKRRQNISSLAGIRFGFCYSAIYGTCTSRASPLWISIFIVRPIDTYSRKAGQDVMSFVGSCVA